MKKLVCILAGIVFFLPVSWSQKPKAYTPAIQACDCRFKVDSSYIATAPVQLKADSVFPNRIDSSFKTQCGYLIVPENRIGLVTKKFVVAGPNRELPDGRIIATKGEAGFQAKTLAPGLYWNMWPWQYAVDMVPFMVIPEGKIGLLLSKDGAEIPTGRILARKVDCDNFQDAQKFLDNGGQRGRQTAFMTAGSSSVPSGKGVGSIQTSRSITLTR